MGGHGVNLNQLHYHNLASFECVVLVGQVRPKFSCYINLSVYTCICISIFDPSSTYLFVYPQLRICLYKGIAKENLRGGGGNPQNLRTRKGSRVLMGWRDVWGTTSGIFLISMLFYLFLHQYFSIFVILNHFLSFFSYFPIFFISFGSLPPTPPRGYMPGGGGWLPYLRGYIIVSVYLQIYLFIRPSIYCPYNFDIISFFTYLSIILSICHLSIYTFLFCIIRFRM